MEQYSHEHGSGMFVQIGAGAGDLDKRANYRDGFTEFIKKLPRDRIKTIILVEPNPLNIPNLRECWKDYPQAKIYELAIVPRTYTKDTMTIYYCPSDAPHYQVASINKSHIQKHYGAHCELKDFAVPVRHLEPFLNEVTKGQIELLALDIEGIDGEVILDLEFEKLKLKYLSFEYIHLGSLELPVKVYLEKNNFVFLGKGVDPGGGDHLYKKSTTLLSTTP